MGEDNYAPLWESCFSPDYGVGVALLLWGINDKRNQTDLSTKKRFAFAIKLFLHGMCPDGFILSMKKRGGEKVDEEDDEIRKKIILSSCQGVPFQSHTIKRFAFAFKLFLQK